MEASRLVLPYCKNIDLNLGCPQGIARKGGYGAFLLSNYDQIEKIVRELRMEKIPYSVKIRLLPDLSSTLRLCELFQREGVSFITVHGRLKEEKREFTGPCNWGAIRQIVSNSSVPIIANGGIDSLESAQRCIQETGVSAVMSGEALLENPTLFSPNTKELTVREVCEEYLDLEEQYPSLQKEIRKHLFKLLHRGLSVDVESRSQLANLRLITKQDKDRVRELIAHVESVMKEKEGEWLIQNATLRSDSWYRRHRRSSFSFCNKHKSQHCNNTACRSSSAYPPAIHASSSLQRYMYRTKRDSPESAAHALLFEYDPGFHNRHTPISSHTPYTTRDNPPRNRSDGHVPRTAPPHSLFHISSPSRLLFQERIHDSRIDTRAARHLHFMARRVVVLRLTSLVSVLTFHPSMNSCGGMWKNAIAGTRPPCSTSSSSDRRLYHSTTSRSMQPNMFMASPLHPRFPESKNQRFIATFEAFVELNTGIT